MTRRRGFLAAIEEARVAGLRRGYSGARPDVVSLVRGKPANVLDIGCGAGMTAALVREISPGARLVGVEPDSQLAAQAGGRLDVVIAGDAEQDDTWAAVAALAPFDLVVCADVLEHMVDPAKFLQKLPSCLAPGGQLITSIPNVRHWSTFFSLGLLGTWPRRERGIHDKTHLRFFARKDVIALGAGAGFRCVREKRNLRLHEPWSWTMPPARLLDFWPFRAFFTFQYLHCWEVEKP